MANRPGDTAPAFDPGFQPDKTIVEGSLPPSQGAAGPTRLTPGARVDATSVGKTNPYLAPTQTPRTTTGQTQTGGGQNQQDVLPNGSALASGTIVGVLGTGGMARVYKIWNDRLEVYRAVKMLLPNQHADLKNRFDTEAKITAKLRHPNIVEVHAVGEFNGLPFLEMEFVEGRTLETIIHKQGKLPDPVCSSIAILVARALSFAHGQEFTLYQTKYHGIIHRDLKPANIMISTSGDLRLMDFGIARPTEASLHTVEGNIVGTMQYLSPEQLDGVDIDNRTDIYSFGAILYEILTGTKTFPQDTITNLMKKKITNEYRLFNEFDFSVAPALAKIAIKCLQLNKEQRYPNAEALLKELETAHRSLTPLSPTEVLKSYVTNPEGFSAPSKKGAGKKLGKPVVIGAAAALGLVGAIAGFLATGPEQVTEPAKKPVVVAPAKPLPALPMEQPQAGPPPTLNQGMRPLDGSTVPQPAPQVTPAPKPLPPVAATSPRQPAAQRPPADKPRPLPVEKPKPPVESRPSSPLEKIQAKYETDDLVEAGRRAANRRAFSDAIVALEAVPDNHPQKNLKFLLLMEAYIESGMTGKAEALAGRVAVTDAEYDFLSGRIAEMQGKDKKALDLYQSAMIKPSIVRDRGEVLKDALYYTAKVRTAYYEKAPSPDTRMQAMNAWLKVKNAYTKTPDHGRFKEANKVLTEIQ